MDKRQFFDDLHITLENKYNIPNGCIGTIRSFALGHNLSREDILNWADGKIKKSIQSKSLPSKRLTKLFHYLELLDEVTWKDITQKTQFDKGGDTK